MKKILKDRLLIEKLKVNNKESIIDVVEDESGPLKGKVIKIGSHVEDIEEGDIVFYKENDSLSITLDEGNFLILREYDIIGIL